MASPDLRPLGRSEIRVSPLSLGSWRTFERIGFDASLAVLCRALQLGITFLDDARYDDESGHAELATGFSEVLFGRLIAACEAPRAALVIANKLWWEHWPRQDARAELTGSLERMGLDHVDLIYATPRPDDLSVERVVEEIAGLLGSGLARAWAVTNWSAADTRAAAQRARGAGIAGPAATQLPYSLVNRAWAEGDGMPDVLRDAGISLVPSAALAFGLLTGKYATARKGRMAGELREPRSRPALDAAAELAALAQELQTTPAALALAFALDNPQTASVLFGATSPAQLEQNAAAVALHRSLDADARARLHATGAA